MSSYDNKHKNKLVCDLDQCFDESFFKYAYIWNSSNSNLTSKIMNQLKLDKVLAYLALGTFLVFYVLNRKNYYKSENQTTIRPTIAAVSEPASLNRNTLPIATSRFASISCSLPFQIRTPQSSEPKVTFSTRPGLGLTHSQVQKAGAQSAGLQLSGLKAPTFHLSTKPIAIVRNVSTAVFEYTGGDSELQQKLHQALDLVDQYASVPRNVIKDTQKPPDILHKIKAEFMKRTGQQGSIEDKAFIDFSREYIVDVLRRKHSIDPEVIQEMAGHILIYQCLPTDSIPKIEPVWFEVLNYLDESIDQKKTNNQLHANMKVEAKTQLDENLAAKRLETKNILSSIDSNDVSFFDYLTDYEKARVAYVYFYKRAVHNLYPNCYPGTAGQFEYQNAHLFSKKAGGSAIALNIGTLSDINHCICTEIESLVSQETGLLDGGIPMRAKLATEAAGLRNLQEIAMLAYDANDSIKQKLISIQTAASEMDWKKPTAGKDVCEFLNICTKYPDTNPFFISANKDVIAYLSTSLGYNIYAPIGARIAAQVTNNNNPEFLFKVYNSYGRYASNEIYQKAIACYNDNLSNSGPNPPISIE